MIINISELFNQYGESKEINFISEIKCIKYNSQEIVFSKPVEIIGIMKSGGKIFDLDATIKATFDINCDRCLEKFEYSLEFDFNEKFSLDGGNDDIRIISGSTIDLNEIVEENILLNLPLQFLCNEECEGLCSTCGCNKNFQKCNCNEHDIDPRFSILKNLFK